jgi:hypothetical protein
MIFMYITMYIEKNLVRNMSKYFNSVSSLDCRMKDEFVLFYFGYFKIL